jgi:hypothetical protein
VERYLSALATIVMQKDNLKARRYDQVGGKSAERALPSPVPVWAGDVITRELRWLRDRITFLESWLERPHNIKRARKKKLRCTGCNRGLQRGAKYCGQCGVKAKEVN